MQQIKVVWQLQEYDTRLLEISNNVKSINEKLKLEDLKTKISETRFDLDNKRTQIEVDKMKIQRNTHKLNQYKFEIEEINKTLYSGETNDVKKLTRLQEEEKELKDKYGNIETDTINLMDKVENDDIDVINIENEHNRIIQKINDLEVKYKDELNKLKSECENINEQKKELIKNIDDDLFKRYETIKEKKSKPIALVKNDICSGCHMDIPLYIISKLKKNDEIINCDNCGRIILLKED